MRPHRQWRGGALALGPLRPLSKGDNDTLELEDFTLVTVWRVDLGAGSQDVGQETSKRTPWQEGGPGGARSWNCGKSYQNIGTDNLGEQNR